MYLWGVDSAEAVTEDLYQCVVEQFGHPGFWGRYLLRVPGISEGLTHEELALLRRKRVRLLPIYNSLAEALGIRQGVAAANHATFQARLLGVPAGVPLFANLERFFDIDAAWIRGWTETVQAGGYQSGIYHDPVSGAFELAFCEAVREDPSIKGNTILWSAEPVLAPSGPGNQPEYRPEVPNCGGKVWIWQYSRQTPQCPVDTDLASPRLVQLLW